MCKKLRGKILKGFLRVHIGSSKFLRFPGIVGLNGIQSCFLFIEGFSAKYYVYHQLPKDRRVRWQTKYFLLPPIFHNFRRPKFWRVLSRIMESFFGKSIYQFFPKANLKSKFNSQLMLTFEAWIIFLSTISTGIWYDVFRNHSRILRPNVLKVLDRK